MANLIKIKSCRALLKDNIYKRQAVERLLTKKKINRTVGYSVLYNAIKEMKESGA